MQFRRPHPWDGQYALPENVLAEPPRFGTLTTGYMPRKTIDAPALAPPWEPGYAYPEYIKDEPLGAGVFRTKYTPRRTVDTLVPRFLGDDEGGVDASDEPGINIYGGTQWLQRAQARYGAELPMLGGVGQPINFDSGQAWIEAAENRYGFSLGNDGVPAASASDAIGAFGRRAAEQVLRRVRKLPRTDRALGLRTALDNLEPGLWRRVVLKAKEYEGAGATPEIALKRALASQMSTGLISELVRAGKSGAVNRQSMLGACCRMHPMGADEVVVARRGTRGTAAPEPYGSGTDADPWRFPPQMIEGTLRDHRIINVPAIQRAYRSALERYRIGVGSQREFLPNLVRQGKLPFTTFTAARTMTVAGRKIDGRAKYGLYHNERSGTLSIRRIPSRRSGPLGQLGSALKSIGKGIIALPKTIAEAGVKGARKIVDVAGDIVDAVGDLACSVVSTEAGQLAAGAGAAAAGQPPQAGVAGAQIAAGLCTGPGGEPIPPPPPPSRFPVVPIAIGGAALLAWWYMSRRKR